jgi:NitT/TauT family transport system ATP-binding protein
MRPSVTITPPQQGTELLRVDQLTKIYGKGADAHVAFENMSLKVNRGELLTVVGPSGCGKTTFLKCIAGLIKPTSGAVTLEGTVVDTVPGNLGFVFQEYGRSLFPWLTVQRNVEFPLRGRVEDKERLEIVDESLTAVGLKKFANRYPRQLSGGMQQRVAIARALAYRPRVLLMDEPFGSVDAYTRAELEDLTLAIRERFDVTILLVTHDIDESVYLGDRVVVLSGSPGRVVSEIDVDLPRERNQVDTRSHPNFVRIRSQVAEKIFHHAI